MSCTHDCGCTPEIRDARTDEWVQIAPESARTATLTPEQPVKAPGRDGDIFLARGTVVEADWPNGSRGTVYVDEGGFKVCATDVGNGSPYSWHDGRIVRVLTEDKPTQEPALPRRIEPEDVRVGMVVERRKGEAAVRDRAEQIDGDLIMGVIGAYLWMPGYEVIDWTLWLVEDAPEPVDSDAEALDLMAQAMANLVGSDDATEWVAWAEVALDALRARGFDVTPRAEQ